VILGHLSIADDVHVSAGTVISRSIRKAGTYTGMFPFDDQRVLGAQHCFWCASRPSCGAVARAGSRKGKDNG